MSGQSCRLITHGRGGRRGIAGSRTGMGTVRDQLRATVLDRRGGASAELAHWRETGCRCGRNLKSNPRIASDAPDWPDVPRKRRAGGRACVRPREDPIESRKRPRQRAACAKPGGNVQAVRAKPGTSPRQSHCTAALERFTTCARRPGSAR